MSIFVYKNKELSNRMIFEINDKASILKEEPGKVIYIKIIDILLIILLPFKYSRITNILELV